MAKLKQLSEEEEMAEILRLALLKDSSGTADLRSRLYAAADELQISKEAVAAAEAEFRERSVKQQELFQYRRQLVGSFWRLFGIYAIVNFFLFMVNLMSYREDREIWFPYALGGWGVLVAIRAMSVFRNIEWDDERFQKWRTRRSVRTLIRTKIRERI